VVGTVPIKISMINPIPFCPSFEPWKKLTPVQVRMSIPRIHHGGGSVPAGASYSCLSFTNALSARKSVAASAKPNTGESRSERPILPACAQSTPLVPERAVMIWFAMPTPMIEPIKVCELEAGRPNHQVPRFHRIAATNNAKTIANPAPEPTCKINSTGSSETMPNATAPVELTTPAKFQKPDQTTAICGSRECV
jgi:hypothetical protein